MPPRKRSKNTNAPQKKKKLPAVDTSAAQDAGPSDVVQIVLPRRNVRGRRGGLKDMPTMPLDILFEIFSLLHPRDLLSLARTSRAFRALLMNRNMASFWKTARIQTAGLPDIPPYLSEPAYANFLFCNHCHGCGQQKKIRIFCEFFARYCNTCQAETLCDVVHASYLLHRFIGNSPRITPEAVLSHVVFSTGRYPAQSYYHKPEIEAVKTQWETLPSDSEAQDKFLQDRYTLVKENEKYAEDIEEWLEAEEERKRSERDSLKKDRLKDIHEKLREEGWGKDLDKMDKTQLLELSKLDVVNRTTRLGPRGWNAIRVKVLDFMKSTRELRLSQEYYINTERRLQSLARALKDYCHSQWRPGADFQLIGKPADYALMPEIRTIIEDPAVTDDDSEDVFHKMSAILPDITKKWVEHCREQFATLVRDALSEAGVTITTDPLELAITSFKCRTCTSGKTLRWTEAIIHGRHCTAYNEIASHDRYELVIRNFIRGSISGNGRFLGVDRFRASHNTSASARAVVVACGLDPYTATPADLHACAVRLRCHLCAGIAKQEVFDWEGAMYHDVDRHSCVDLTDEEVPHWDRVDVEHAARVAELQEALYAESLQARPYGRSYTCTWCHESTLWSISDVSHHFYIHQKRDSALGVDYVVSKGIRPAITMFSPLLVKNLQAVKVVEQRQGFFASF